MKTFRVVCTKNPESTIIDFATADTADNSKLTHDNLLKLRQYQTPNSQALLPPLMLMEDDNGKTSVDFEKPELASGSEYKLLSETEPRILASYNKFKYSGQDSTLQITEENTAIAYSFIDPYKMETSSQQEENLKERIIKSRRLMNTKAMKKNLQAPSLMERFYKSNGD